MLTEQLSDFLYEVRYDSLPSKAVDNAKLYLEDLLGVAAAGSVQPQGGIWRSYFAAGDGQQEATAWNSGLERFSCEHAAALNAACAHVMDMDDVHNASITHLGAVTIPAALAVGQKLHRSGREVLAAIAAGYEIGARVGEAINPGSYHYWHTTGVVGALCSAVAAGKLMGLDRKKLLHAIGSAGTQAAGLWQFLEDGAMSKTLHTANGTLCGLRSARLAALGFTAAEDILAGDRGLLGAMTPDNHPEALTRVLSWENCALLTTRRTTAPNCCGGSTGWSRSTSPALWITPIRWRSTRWTIRSHPPPTATNSAASTAPRPCWCTATWGSPPSRRRPPPTHGCGG